MSLFLWAALVLFTELDLVKKINVFSTSESALAIKVTIRS